MASVRAYERTPFKTDVTLLLGHTTQKLTAGDISETGMFLTGVPVASQGDQVGVEFSVGDKFIQIPRASVRWVGDKIVSGGYKNQGLGLHFVDLDAESREAIAQLVSAAQVAKATLKKHGLSETAINKKLSVAVEDIIVPVRSTKTIALAIAAVIVPLLAIGAVLGFAAAKPEFTQTASTYSQDAKAMANTANLSSKAAGNTAWVDQLTGDKVDSELVITGRARQTR